MPNARISELPAASTLAETDLAPLVQTSAASILETRRATLAQLRAGVLAERSAHVRDYGAKGDGVTNDAPAIQAAVADLAGKGGGTLLFGPRRYRLASAVTVSGTAVRLQGAGFTEAPAPADGTWLLVDSTGFTPLTFNGVAARGSGLRDMAMAQTHTAIQNAGWAPTDYDWLIRIEDCLGSVELDNLLLIAVNRGIYARNSGRLDIRRLRGQVFTAGVEIDECYDVPRLHNLHFWTFWSSDTNVVRWQQANGDALIFRRSDGAFIDQAFALGYRSMFRFAGSAAGVTTKFNIGQAYADFTRYGVLIEANGVDGQIGSMTCHGESFNAAGAALGGAVGLQVNASNCRVQIGNFRVDAVEDNALRLEQAGNRLDIGALRCLRFNSRANGAAAIHLADSGAGTPNAVYLASPALLEGATTGPLVNTGSNGILAMQAPAGRVARPGLQVGGSDSGLWQPSGTSLAASAGGAEVLRATSAGAVTLGGAPGLHGLEVGTPGSASNRLMAAGSATGSPVSLLATGADANIGLVLGPKGGGALLAQVPDNGLGGGNARGANAVDLQASTRSAAAQVASGAQAFLGAGRLNTASGADAAVPGGYNNTASGAQSFAMGEGNVADGSASMVLGRFGTAKGITGAFVTASGRIAANGDAQAGQYGLSGRASGGATVRLTANGGAAGASNIANIANNSAWGGPLTVVATDTTTRNAAVWHYSPLLLLRAGSAATLELSLPTPAFVSRDRSGQTPSGIASGALSITADTTNGGLNITFTPPNGNTWDVVARLATAEVQ